MHVPTNTLSVLASLNNDTVVAKAKTKSTTIIDVVLLLISVKYSKNTGISKIMTEVQITMSLAMKAIFAPEKI